MWYNPIRQVKIWMAYARLKLHGCIIIKPTLRLVDFDLSSELTE